MTWQAQLKGDSLSWLLEPDTPAVRHMALRDLLERPPDDAKLMAARKAALKEGPIPAILDAMEPEGFWVKPGAGYSPKYRSTVWSVITLAQCGAHISDDPRIATACAYVLAHTLTGDGRFSCSGKPYANIDCLHGNLCAALLDLGYQDWRLVQAMEWAARSITGEGVAPQTSRESGLRFTHYNSDAGFVCRANNHRPCAWGAIKLMLAFSKWPDSQRTPLMERAIRTGIEFLLGVDPAGAAYPVHKDGDPPDKRWWMFGFPVFYVTDFLQNLEALVALGYGQDSRVVNALSLLLAAQDGCGRWKLGHKYYAGQTWATFGIKNQPNKWVTLRALRVLKAAV